MIDFVKVKFSNKEAIDRFIKNRGTNTTRKVSRDGKSETFIYYWHNLKFVSTPKETYFEGSLHGFYNACKGKIQKNTKPKWINYNNFTLGNLHETIKILESKLSYDLTQTTITICEFGFNLEIDESPQDFIEKYVLMYKLKYPCFDPKYKIKMKFKKFDLEDYYIKIYDKGLQYGLKKNVLRFEVGFKTDELRPMNITSIKDIANPDLLENLYKSMNDKYSELLIVDSFDGNNRMKKYERNMMIKYTNPSFWTELLNEKKYNKRSQHKKELSELISRHSLNSRKIFLQHKLYTEFYYSIYN